MTSTEPNINPIITAYLSRLRAYFFKYKQALIYLSIIF